MYSSRIKFTNLSILFVLLMSACSPVQNNSSIALQNPAPSNINSTSPAINGAGLVAIVKSKKANLRDQPSRSGAIKREVEKNDQLPLLTQNPVGRWYNVRENRAGSSGWIHGSLIVVKAVGEVNSTEETSKKIQTTRPVVPATSGRSYINVDGDRIPSPVFTKSPPAGATARCGDGSYSFSQHRRGTCSHHGGVAEWL
jgi:SH3-like domain-containing protein